MEYYTKKRERERWKGKTENEGHRQTYLDMKTKAARGSTEREIENTEGMSHEGKRD